MSAKKLPSPVTATEDYLNDIALSLRKLVASKEPGPDPKIEIDIREPMQVKVPLPRDFPAFDILHDAGIDYYDDVPKTGMELVEISGIGHAKANQILTRLALG